MHYDLWTAKHKQFKVLRESSDLNTKSEIIARLKGQRLDLYLTRFMYIKTLLL